MEREERNKFSHKSDIDVVLEAAKPTEELQAEFGLATRMALQIKSLGQHRFTTTTMANSTTSHPCRTKGQHNAGVEEAAIEGSQIQKARR